MSGVGVRVLGDTIPIGVGATRDFVREVAELAGLEVDRRAHGVIAGERRTGSFHALFSQCGEDRLEHAAHGLGQVGGDLGQPAIPCFDSPLLRQGLELRPEIAIIAPYLDGALRYTLTQALKQAGLPYRLLRRRSSPRDEPCVRALLTWLALAHPTWGIPVNPFDVA